MTMINRETHPALFALVDSYKAVSAHQIADNGDCPSVAIKALKWSLDYHKALLEEIAEALDTTILALDDALNNTDDKEECTFMVGLAYGEMPEEPSINLAGMMVGIPSATEASIFNELIDYIENN